MKNQELLKILIVVDYQGDFVNGALAIPDAADIAKNIQREIDSNKYKNIIYTMDTHTKEEYESSIEKEIFPDIHCEFGTNGWDLYDIKPVFLNSIEKHNFKIMEAGNETIFTKNDFDIWKGNEIYSKWFTKYIKPKEVEIFVTGVALNYCVIANIKGMVKRGYKVSILKDCVKAIKTLANGDEDPTYVQALEYFEQNNVQFV